MLKNSFDQPSTTVKPSHPDWLEAGPFDASNSVVRFYAGGGRGDILDCIIKHLQSSDDPLFIRGESGSGKTLLSLLLGHKLTHRYHVVHYQNASLSPEQLIQHLFEQLCPLDAEKLMANLAGDAQAPTTTVSFAELKTGMLERQYSEKPVVLILDAGVVTGLTADDRMTQLLHQLGQISQAGRPLIQSVVFEPVDQTQAWPEDSFDPVPGQPHYTLRRLTLNEVHGFLQHHMLLFDYSQQHLFTREMACFITEKSGGLIGSVNEIAREAWLLASIHNDGPIAMKHLVAVTGAARRVPPAVSWTKKIRMVIGRLIRSGGFGLAIFVMSVVVLTATWRLTS